MYCISLRHSAINIENLLNACYIPSWAHFLENINYCLPHLYEWQGHPRLEDSQTFFILYYINLPRKLLHHHSFHLYYTCDKVNQVTIMTLILINLIKHGQKLFQTSLAQLRILYCFLIQPNAFFYQLNGVPLISNFQVENNKNLRGCCYVPGSMMAAVFCCTELQLQVSRPMLASNVPYSP